MTPSVVKRRMSGEFFAPPQLTMEARTTEIPSPREELPVNRWLGMANTDTPFSVATARTCWSPCGGRGVGGVAVPCPARLVNRTP